VRGARLVQAGHANGMNMPKEPGIEVSEKLDRVLRLLAMVAVRGLSQTEQIATLSRVGFSPKEIADVLGTTANTVRVALVGIRKAGRIKKRRAGSVEKESSDEQL
jgi:DNA-binding CsgD family transcriptional regulator